MRIVIALVCCLLIIKAVAQHPATGKIAVQVYTELKAPLENATAELVKSTDSSLVRTALSNKAGLAEFDHVPYGDYIIKISMVNYAATFVRVSLPEGQAAATASPVELKPKPVEIGGVTVTAKKPFIQRLTDRIVVNVESSILSAGSSAMDVLERSPGVNVDQNDLISLRGRAGVIIMIDGKPTAMTGADLANYLKGLPSAAIERIDIITNPSAKYDAAGNSGIIDIRMKKDQRLGTNGTLTAGYGQGVYPKTNAGATINHRTKKINAFGNYNYNYRVGLNHLILDRNFYTNGIYNGGDLKDNYSRSPISAHTVRVGMDFFPSKKTILGFVVNSSFNGYRRNNDNRSIVLDENRQKVNTFQSLATNDDHNNNLVANINFKHRFDSTGRELTADADYGVYNSSSLTLNATRYYKLDGSTLQPNYVLQGDQDGRLSFKTFKADYTNPLPGDAKWEAGFKTSFVSSDNDARFFDVSSGTPQDDVNKTNHFLYKENNNAGYVNFAKKLGKFDMQLGLRGEQTTMETKQLKGNIQYDSSYFQLFPSAFFNYQLAEEQTLGLSLSRRIDRPGYSQLNPFLFLIDVTTYATGSPGLRPQLTWSYELSYTVKSFSFTLGYSRTKDNQNIAIAKFRDVFPNIPSEENVTVQIPVNLRSSDYYGLSISAPFRIRPWWNMINNVNAFYERFNGTLGTTQLNKGKPAVDARTDNTFTLKKGWAAELNGRFNSGGQYGFMVSEPQWGLSAGVQKTVLKSKGTVRFNITDIFWSNNPRAVITYDNYIEKWKAKRETRVATLGFTYRFGNNKVQAARRRTTASEEERQRAGN